MKMNSYLIYAIASSKVNEERPQYLIIEDKFDYEAFFKSFYILLKYKQYKNFFILLSLFLVTNFFILTVNQRPSIVPILLVIMFYSGLEGVNWRIKFLENQGYRLVSKTYANNYEEAINKFENI